MTAATAVTKYRGCFFVAPTVLFVIALTLRHRRLGPMLAWVGSAALISASHWLKNLIYYHDPLYPLLYKYLPLTPFHEGAARAFHAAYWDERRLAKGPLPDKLWAAFKVLFTFSFVPNDFAWHGNRPTFGADLDVTVVAALLHELVNLLKSDPNASRSGELCADVAAKLLEQQGAPAAFGSAVCDCIRVHSFSSGLVPTSLEGRILQDADRLDAIGTIGIARCFATCAAMHRPFYAASDPFCEHRLPDDKLWGVDHFYRKLLSIPQLLHTAKAKEIARARAAFTLQFLERLHSEILL